MIVPDGIVNTRRRIIDLLHARGELSRAELARLTFLSKPTISSVVADLVAEGIIVEGGTGESTGGRRPIMLHLGGTMKLVAGIEIDLTLCRFVLVTLAGQTLRQTTRPTPASADDLPATIIAGLATLLGTRRRETLLGCGLAIPGVVDHTRDVVSFAGRPGWRDLPLRSQLATQLGRPVLITDRGKAAGLGEMWALGQRRRDDLIYLYLGHGIAGAMLFDGSLRLGQGHTAGEIGHMVVDPNGPACSCGRRGCLEAHIATSALLARARSLIDAQTAPALAAIVQADSDDAALTALGDAANAGEPLALNVVAYAARWLALALGNLINALNPAVIILGGPLAGWGAPLLNAIEQHLDHEALPIPRGLVQLVVGQAGQFGAAVGAATLVVGKASELLAEPQAEVSAGHLDWSRRESSHDSRQRVLSPAGH